VGTLEDRGGELGQATVEWTGLSLLAALVAATLLAAGVGIPGVSLAGELGQRLLCAAGLEAASCDETADRPLAAAYGRALAAKVSAHAPTIEYEDGMRALPVDFRHCRADPCSLAAAAGATERSRAGRPVTLFVHVIDCRRGATAARGGAYDCSGERRGRVYIQYWAYYPGSQTARQLLGDSGFHPDDWESYQLRLDRGWAEARASSHHGYNYTSGAGSWPSDLGITSRSAWGEERGRYYVSGGSHAGHASDEGSPRRWTAAAAIRLVPIERLLERSARRYRFAVTPPWRKHVYRDPEYEGTD
jgi:hypothetical protein